MVDYEKISPFNLQVCKRKLIQKFDFEYYKVYTLGQMGKEKVALSGPERKSGGFGIVMKYNPEFIYTVLNRSHMSTIMTLNNNWEFIYEKGYDLFDGEFDDYRTIGIKTLINCDLKVKTQPDWPDRSSKIFCIKTELLWPSSHEKWGFLAPRLQTELLSMGLDFDQTSDNEWPERKILLSRNLDFPTAIEEWGITKHTTERGCVSTPGVRVSLPYPNIGLTSPDDIKKSMHLFTDVLEKTIGALYKMYNKHLPLQKLVFEPPESASAEKVNIASCAYCGSDYSIVHGLTCPHCGASKPHFS